MIEQEAICSVKSTALINNRPLTALLPLLPLLPVHMSDLDNSFLVQNADAACRYAIDPYILSVASGVCNQLACCSCPFAINSRRKTQLRHQFIKLFLCNAAYFPSVQRIEFSDLLVLEPFCVTDNPIEHQTMNVRRSINILFRLQEWHDVIKRKFSIVLEDPIADESICCQYQSSLVGLLAGCFSLTQSIAKAIVHFPGVSEVVICQQIGNERPSGHTVAIGYSVEVLTVFLLILPEHIVRTLYLNDAVQCAGHLGMRFNDGLLTGGDKAIHPACLLLETAGRLGSGTGRSFTQAVNQCAEVFGIPVFAALQFINAAGQGMAEFGILHQ